MRVIVAVALLCLTGCAANAPSVPEGYKGAIATIDDSAIKQSRSRGHLFYVEKINGNKVHNAYVATQDASFNNGPRIAVKGASRPVPAQPLSLHLVGQVHHGAPIGYVFGAGSNYRVDGEVSFTPEAGQRYRVSGRLAEASSAVWVEDINGNIVSPVLERKAGSDEVAVSGADAVEPVAELSREDFLLQLAGGESVGFVTAKLGEPDSISRYDSHMFTERPSTVTYSYDQLGAVVFSARDGKPQFVLKVQPVTRQSDDLEALASQLESSGETLQQLAQSYYQFDNLGREKLDLFAAKVWRDRNTEDRFEIDALSWLCKVLAKSGDARYRSLLAKVANAADSAKLRKYARVSLDQLPATDVPQFDVGDS